MGEKTDVYSKIRMVILLALVAIIIAIIGWMSTLGGRITSMKEEIKNEQNSISSLLTSMASLTEKVNTLEASRLTNRVAVNLPSLVSTYTSIQPMEYITLLRSAPLTVPSSIELSTVSSTDITSFKSILEKTRIYEIMENNGTYSIAYPASFGKTYSIQLLSSPYPDRIMDLLKTLRGISQPVFKIDYANQSALFLGVFSTYLEAKEYSKSINSTSLTSVVGTKPSKWLPRRIP